jgi:hypothetical protein
LLGCKLLRCAELPSLIPWIANEGLAIAKHEIGGLGPELAEDHSTTLIMSSGGWIGIHSIDAEAHGEGPGTFTDAIIEKPKLFFFHRVHRAHRAMLLLFAGRWWNSHGPVIQDSFVVKTF